MRRRELLSACGGVGLGALAGCLGDEDDSVPGGGDADDDGEGDDDSDGNDDLDATIETTGSDCADPTDDWIGVEFGDVVVVEGIMPAPTPCHEAVLERATVENETLSLVVDVRSTLEEDEDCVQCAGAVEYEARIEAEGVDRVVVDHRTGGEHDTDDDAVGEPEIVDASIETIDTDCESGEAKEPDVTVDGDEVILTGHRSAPTPCHDATLEDAGIDEGVLSLSVGLDRHDGVCVECVGVVFYEVRVEVTDADGLESVRVDHVDDGRFELDLDDD